MKFIPIKSANGNGNCGMDLRMFTPILAGLTAQKKKRKTTSTRRLVVSKLNWTGLKKSSRDLDN